MTAKQHLSGAIFEEESEITLDQLTYRFQVTYREIVAMVDEGILEPRPGQFQSGCDTGHDSHQQQHEEWLFDSQALKRLMITLRLQRDLGINLAGAALALDLLEQIDTLTSRNY